jgi:carbon storage regulator
MLVLSRWEGQSIVIGGVVTLTVMRSRCGQCTISFNAPRGISIHRSEVEERIQKDTQLSIANKKEGKQ